MINWFYVVLRGFTTRVLAYTTTLHAITDAHTYPRYFGNLYLSIGWFFFLTLPLPFQVCRRGPCAVALYVLRFGRRRHHLPLSHRVRAFVEKGHTDEENVHMIL